MTRRRTIRKAHEFLRKASITFVVTTMLIAVIAIIIDGLDWQIPLRSRSQIVPVVYLQDQPPTSPPQQEPPPKKEKEEDLLLEEDEDDLLFDDVEEAEDKASPAPMDQQAIDLAHEKVLLGDRFPSATACRDCHPKHYREWSVSQHAYAQMSPIFNAMHGTILKLTNGTNGDFCIRCTPRWA